MIYKIRLVHASVDGVTSTVTVRYSGGSGAIKDPRTGTAVLAVFNAGRDCFWDSSTKTFTTDPSSGATGMEPSPASVGVVQDWDLQVTDGGVATFFLTVMREGEDPSYGALADTWASLDVEADQVPLVVEMLLSQVCLYRNGELTNGELESLD